MPRRRPPSSGRKSTPAPTLPLPTPGKAVERILLIDDDAGSMFVLAEYLRQCGFAVDCAENAESASVHLRSHHPDLILLDVLMPDTDGFEICRMLKAHPEDREIPVLFVTGLHETKEKVKAFAAGAVDYLTKPVDPEEALARIRHHLGMRAAQVELIRDRDKLLREMLRRSTTEDALQTSLDRALIVATSTGVIQFCSAPAASLLRTHIPDMAPNQLPPGLLAGGAIGDLRIERVPAPEGKDCVLLALHVAQPPASFRDLLSLGLTPRETEILYWIAQGKTSPEAGLILGISMNTVKKHVQNILPKLGVETRFAAALAASDILNRLHAHEPGALAALTSPA